MFCRHCGKEVDENWKVCPSCGTAIGERQENTEKEEAKATIKEPKKMKKKRKKLPLILLAIVAIVIILVMTSGDEDDTSKSIAELDFADYVSEDPAKFLEDYDDFEAVEGLGSYMDESQQVVIALDENDNWYSIGIESGENTELPSFAKVKIGVTTDFTTSELEKYGYEILGIEGNVFFYGNAETDATVLFEKASDDTVCSIVWNAEGCKELESTLYEEEETTESVEASDGEEKIEFIGMPGVYLTSNVMDGEMTGKIEIIEVGENAFSFTLSALELDYPVLSEEAVIVDSHTARATVDGLTTITFDWSDPENMYVTNSGIEGDWMDAGVVELATGNQSYIRPYEFN